MKKLVLQFFKFGIVGVINTCSSWVFYYSLIFFNINYLVATTIAYFLSSIIGYFLNKIWVFKKKSDNKDKTSLFRYYVVYISSYFLNMLCMYTLVDLLHVSEYISPILVLFVTVPYNFLFSRFWVFKTKDKNNLEEMSNLHTFAICAYGESPYLEECVKSVINQNIKTNYLISTSTPNKKIEKIAKKYDIPYYIKKSKSDICDDWNFAYNKAKTELVTIAHQDDIYERNYTEELLKNYDSKILMYNTNYNPYKNGKVADDKNSKIKEILKFFVKFKFFARFKFFKVMSLAFGNTINCPSVTYNKKLLGNSVFTSDLKFGLDWDTFLKISKMKGIVLYIPKKLINYRIHDGATTKEFIVNNKRVEEDIIMFRKIWPNFIVRIIMKFYRKAYDTYN